jgi:hypothetical protein
MFNVGPFRWYLRETCSEEQVCVETETNAFCAISDKPSEFCSVNGFGEFCEGNRAFGCQFGYMTYETDCLSCKSFPYMVCEGGPGEPCTRQEDCIESLRCEPTGQRFLCQKPTICRYNSDCWPWDCVDFKGQRVCDGSN